MKKKIPTFKSDRAAAAFVDKADLTQYDLSGATLTRFEIKPKDKSINLRVSGELYLADTPSLPRPVSSANTA